MADALKEINLRSTSQSERARPEQVENSAGGYSFKLGDEARIHRFLTIGSASGTYYTGERELTKENAQVVIDVARSDRGVWLVEKIVELSVGGRTPKQDQLIFSLAVVASVGNDEARKAALDAVSKVCRTGTTLFQFAAYSQQFRGWGRGLRRAIGSWFTDKPVEDVAYQVVKYRQRHGWSQRDLLRSAHPVIDIPSGRALFNWLATGSVETSRGPGGETRPVGATVEDLPQLISAFEEAQAATKVSKWVELIKDNPLSWEMLPDIALKEKAVWAALITKGMPQTALQRQLPRLTNLGIFDDRDILNKVTAQLQDEQKLRKGRVHPLNLMVALKTYARGISMRGSSTWTPNSKIIDALDAAFYTSYGTIEPANKRTLVALDVSGSMGSLAAGLPVSCRELSCALGLVTLSTEPDSECVGFTGGGGGYWGQRATNVGDVSGLTQLSISPRQRLDDAVRTVYNLPFGGTDCSLPMRWAAQAGREFDTFMVVTDGETWAGPEHVHQSLAKYRQKTGIDARCVIVAVTSSGFTLADPQDAGMLDIAGFDSSVPNLISSFSRGDI